MSQYCDNFEFSENNQDHFEMMPDSGDTFQFWQGLQGPYFVPAIDQDGWLSWTNNGGLPNPTPVQIVGKDGRGITLTGYCETVADLPEDPEQGEAWAVGEEEPFECYAWFGGWVDMGLLFPPGPPGQDGVSPAVTITTTTTGHKVKITDKDHPAGQEFDVENGEDGDPGPGVPAGGSAGQYLKKASEADYDGEWDTMGAGDVAYDDSLTYATGTVGEELSAQKNTLSSLDSSVTAVENGLAIIVDGDTCSVAVPVGGYAYIKNNTHGLVEGLYTNSSSSAFPTSGGTANSTIFTAVSSGGLNDLKTTKRGVKIVHNSILTTGTTIAAHSGVAKAIPVTAPTGYTFVGHLSVWATGTIGVIAGFDGLADNPNMVYTFINNTRNDSVTLGNQNAVHCLTLFEPDGW